MKKGVTISRRILMRPLFLCLLAAMVFIPSGYSQEVKTRVSPDQRIVKDKVVRTSVGSCAAPTELNVDKINVKEVHLSWKSPEELIGIYDGFEGHPDFKINSAGDLGWSYIDLDNSTTYSISNYVYPGVGSKMAYQVFNPWSVPNFQNPRATPHSGKKMLADFSAQNTSNNDWLISPELKFTEEFRLTFFAASFDDKYGMERIKVGYSTTDNSPSSFTFVQQGDFIEVPDPTKNNYEWAMYEFKIPSNAKYVAINCVSNDAFVLMIDDIYLSTNKIIPMGKSIPNYVIGFNVYRNDVALNKNVITDLKLIDVVPDFGIYKYSVEAVYTDGCVSEKVSLDDIEVPNIHWLPFYEDFATMSFDTNFWEMDPTSDNGWMFDYIVGDTVQWLVSFANPALTNYSHSLISKDLDARDSENIWLRYDMSFDGYSKSTLECLDVEVFNGTEWKSVKKYNNQGDAYDGDLPEVREYLNISSFIKAGNMFKVRFRAHGEAAYSIMYWAIDNIKVWNMVSSTITGIVKHAGTPIEGVEVVLYSDEGDNLTAITDANGQYKFENIEAMAYRLRVYHNGYNNWGLDVTPEKGINSYDINLTAPVLSFTNGNGITETIKAEELKEGVLSVSNSGNGSMDWSAEIVYNDFRKSTPKWEVAKTFTASDLSQQSIAFDGENYYTASSIINLGGMFWKYDKNGRFIEGFQVKDVKTSYNMAYDGLYFYAASGEDFIYVLDLKNKRLVKKLMIEEINDLKHLCYDSKSDSFWGGGYGTMANISKNGELLSDVKNVNMSCTGSAYDPYNVNGASIWVLDLGAAEPGYGNNNDLATIRRYDLKTMQLTDEFHSAVDVPNFPHGVPGFRTFCTGLFGTTELVKGRFTLLGIISHDPSLIFAYDMYSVPNWLQLPSKRGKLDAGESMDLNLTFDGLELVDGDVKTAKIKFSTVPDLGQNAVDVTLNINGKADYARPLNLTCSVVDDVAIALNWAVADGESAPTSYNIYRNGELLNNITTLTFTDNNLKAGLYKYHVTAVYDEGEESRASDEVKAEIKLGIPCYYPYSLKAENVSNRDVKLTWLDPNSGGLTAATIRWDNGINDDGVGLETGGKIRVAAKWTTNELVDYRQMRIASVNFYAYDLADFTIKIYENETLTYSQAVNGVVYGYNMVVLNDAIYVDNTKDLMVGYDVEHAQGSRPIGVDAGPAVNGKGNMVYFEDTGWSTFLTETGMNVNFNIAVNLVPKNGVKAEETNVLGYNIYRDGNKMNSALVNGLEYTDAGIDVGSYVYNVTAQYDICESDFSNNAIGEIFNINNHDAPSNLSANIVLNRDINLTWDFPIVRSGSEYKRFDFVNSFITKDAGEQAVASDNKHIYTSFWQRPGVFNKYTVDGIFIEQFTIADVEGIRDLTFDGEYFYGGALTPKLYKLDLENKVKVGELVVPYEVRHCTFIPELDGGLGGFEIGDWESTLFITKNGAIIKKGANVKSAFGSAYFDGKMYYSCQTGTSKCEIHEYDLNTNLPTGNVIDLGDYYQYKITTGATAGGLSVIKYANGSSALLANIQDAGNNRVVAIELQGNKLIKGFNIYRDGIKRNTEGLLANRSFNDYESAAATYKYEVEAIYVDDVVSAKSISVDVTIVPSDVCNKPIDFKANAEKRDVVLSWVADERIDDLDNVETYESFSIASNENWTMVDLDGKRPKEIDGITFANMSTPCSFMVFDFSATTPAMTNIAYSGKKVFASFSPMDNSTSKDLLISKKLSFTEDFKFSFMARGLDANVVEHFLIAYSTTGNNPADFALLTTKKAEVLNQWERFEYTMPAGSKYIAIYAVSKNGVALLIDNLIIGDPETGIHGYNVYRNDVKLNSELLKVGSYKDLGVDNGTYTYKVNAMYTTSCVSDFTEDATVVMDYRMPCFPPTNVSAAKLTSGVKIDWKAPVIDVSYNLTHATGEPTDYIGIPEGGIYGIACRWSVSDLRRYNAYSIYEVSMAFGDVPGVIYLAIYQDGKLEYYQEVMTAELGSINRFVLDTPYKIDIEKDLLIAFHVEADQDMFPFGKDAGPAVEGKGDLWTTDGGVTWASANNGGNWVMNALLELRRDRTSLNKSNEMIGYNVYRNDVKLNRDPITNITYTDEAWVGGKQTYKVAAIYEDCGEALSKGVVITLSSVEETGMLEVMSIYPNPASESRFTIRGVEWKEGDIVDIHDISGKSVYSREIIQGDLSTISNNELYITDFELKNGVYVVRVVKEDKVYSVKLIIKK